MSIYTGTDARITSIAVYSNAVLQTTYTDGIVDSSITVSEVFADKQFEVGKAYSACFECDLDKADDLTGKTIHVTQKATDAQGVSKTWVLFHGIVDSRKSNGDGRSWHIVAYDRLYSLAKRDMSGWWQWYWNGVTDYVTIKDVFDALCTSVSLTTSYTASDLVNRTSQLRPENMPAYERLPFSEVLRWTCQLMGVVPHMSREGVLNLIRWNTESPEDLTGLYDLEDSEIGDANVSGYTSVKISQLGTVQATAGDSDASVLDIADNPLIAKGKTAAQLQTYCSNLLSRVNGAFRPMNLEMVIASPDLTVGKAVSVTVGNSTVTGIITELTTYGTQCFWQTANCKGDALTEGTAPEQDSLTAKVREQDSTIASQGATITSQGATISQHTTQIAGKSNSSDIIKNINTVAQSALSINADKININGAVSANGTFSISTVGNVTATGGKIGGWTLTDRSLASTYENQSTGDAYQVLLQANVGGSEQSSALLVRSYNSRANAPTYTNHVRMTYGGLLEVDNININGGKLVFDGDYYETNPPIIMKVYGMETSISPMGYTIDNGTGRTTRIDESGCGSYDYDDVERKGSFVGAEAGYLAAYEDGALPTYIFQADPRPGIHSVFLGNAPIRIGQELYFGATSPFDESTSRSATIKRGCSYTQEGTWGGTTNISSTATLALDCINTYPIPARSVGLLKVSNNAGSLIGIVTRNVSSVSWTQLSAAFAGDGAGVLSATVSGSTVTVKGATTTSRQAEWSLTVIK